MTRISDFFRKISDWLFVGKRLPIIIVAFVIIAVTATVVIVYSMNKPDPYDATIYLTVEGLGDLDFKNRQIKIKDGDPVADVFSLKYENIYEEFGQPFIRNNEFQSFMGVKKTAEKSFRVKIDGIHDNALDNAYLRDGQVLTITYGKN